MDSRGKALFLLIFTMCYGAVNICTLKRKNSSSEFGLWLIDITSTIFFITQHYYTKLTILLFCFNCLLPISVTSFKRSNPEILYFFLQFSLSLFRSEMFWR